MNFGPTIPFGQALIIYFVTTWILIWKGIALWRAAQSHQRNWFIVMLVLNLDTLGILEIIYLFRFAKKRLTLKDIQHWFEKTFTRRSSK